jgi:hypothetical protein
MWGALLDPSLGWVNYALRQIGIKIVFAVEHGLQIDFGFKGNLYQNKSSTERIC